MPVPLTPADEYREEILDAQAMSADTKFRLGLELFDRVCQLMADGIRAEHPEATEEEVRRILLARIELAERLEART
jgi:truncated hemoglobin YjbI